MIYSKKNIPLKLASLYVALALAGCGGALTDDDYKASQNELPENIIRTSSPQIISDTLIPMPVGLEHTTYQVTVLDLDSEPADLSYSITTSPTYITATIDVSTGLVTFSNFASASEDSFTVKVSDGENEVSATISLAKGSILSLRASSLKTSLTMSPHAGHTHHVADNDHEYVAGATLSADKNKLVTFSRWHNKLNILNTSDKAQAATEQFNSDYLWVDAGTDQTDSTSGASGQDLTKIMTRDGNHLFSLVENAGKNNGKNSEGIYRLDIESDNFATNLKYAEVSSKVDSKNYYLNAYLSDMDLSADGSKLVAVDSKSASADRKILLFSNVLNLNSYEPISTNGNKAKTISFSQDGTLVYTGSIISKFDNSLVVYDVASKQEVGRLSKDVLTSLGVSGAYPSRILDAGNNKVFITLEGGHKIYQLDVADKSNITVNSKVLETAEIIKDISLVSFENNDYLLAVENQFKMKLFKLNGVEKAPLEITTSDNILDAFQLSETQIAVIHGKKDSGFFVTYYDLKNE